MASSQKEMVEEILENAVDILEEAGSITTEALAQRLGISLSELKPELEGLERSGLLGMENGDIVLTRKGLKFGKKMVRKHRLLERFLYDVLGLRKDRVHEEACRLEHALSDDAEQALCRFLDHPTQCPDDNRPIPPCKHGRRVKNCEKCGTGGGRLLPLSELDEGKSGKVRFIRGARGAHRRLRDMGIIPERVITVRRRSPFGGPIELLVCGTKLALGRGIAEKIFVEVC